MKLFSKISLLLFVLFFGLGVAKADFDVATWDGHYRGFIDGRNASLIISFIRNVTNTSRCHDSVTGERQGSQSTFSVELRDVERNVVWRRSCIKMFGADAPKVNKWENLRLRNVNSNKVDNIGSLYMHGWDTDFITGLASYRGQPTPRLYIRAGRNLPPCSANGVRNNRCRYE